MKNKWIKTVAAAMAAVCTAACIAGCGAENAKEQPYEEMAAVYEETSHASDDSAEGPQAMHLAMPKGQQGESVQAFNTSLFDGQSMRIRQGKGNTLLALKEDTLYLYDVASAQIKAETKTEHWDFVTFYPYRDGYCAIGQIMKGKADGHTQAGGEQMVAVAVEADDTVECLCVYYDDLLNEIRRISLQEIVSGAEWAAWAVSSDGAVLGYYDQWDGLNLYDVADRAKRQLLNAEEGIEAGLLTVTALFFDAKDERLVFTGQTDEGGRTVASWGRVGTDGTGFENHILQYDLGMAVGYSGGKLLLGEDSIFFTGGMGVIDTKTGKPAYNMDMKGALPVSGPFFSEDGTVFATAALDTNQMEVTVRRTADLAVLYQEVIQDDREEMFYRSPQICLFPELETYIVCMGGHNGIPQRSVLLH